MNRFIIWHTDGTSEESNVATLLTLPDNVLKSKGITSIDRWSDALDDYVEARKVF